MNYKQRVHMRAMILGMSGKKCPNCHLPCQLKFHSELDDFHDRFLEVCPLCEYQSYVDIDYIEMCKWMLEINDS